MYRFFNGLLLVVFITLASVSCVEARDFMRGDVNEDGSVNIADGVKMLDYMFLSGFTYCVDANDVDNENTTDDDDD